MTFNMSCTIAPHSGRSQWESVLLVPLCAGHAARYEHSGPFDSSAIDSFVVVSSPCRIVHLPDRSTISISAVCRSTLCVFYQVRVAFNHPTASLDEHRPCGVTVAPEVPALPQPTEPGSYPHLSPSLCRQLRATQIESTRRFAGHPDPASHDRVSRRLQLRVGKPYQRQLCSVRRGAHSFPGLSSLRKGRGVLTWTKASDRVRFSIRPPVHR